MRKPTWIPAVALAACALACPRDARADETGLEGLQVIAYLIGAVAVVDLGFAVYDGVVAAQGQLPNPIVSGVEALWTGPQIPVAITLARESSGEARGLYAAATGLTVALTLHGVWGMVAHFRHQNEATGSSSSALEAPASAPVGLGLSGRF